MKKTGVYPGTFDPVTRGHMDIICRAAKLVDRLVIGVAANPGKSPLFSLEERVAMLEDEIAHAGLEGPDLGHVEVQPFDILTITFVEQLGAHFLIRGLRAVSDFEYEFQMAGMNARLNPKVETVFLMASDRYQLIASRLVKEIGVLDGDVSPFVSERVRDLMVARFAELKARKNNPDNGD